MEEQYERNIQFSHQQGIASNGTGNMVCQIVDEEKDATNNSGSTPLTPCALPADVEIMDEVEWASEDPTNPSPSEYARRPRIRPMEDPCGCTPAYDEETDTIDTRPCCVDTTCVLFACQEECRKNCEAGELCGNKRITKKQWKKVSVVDAGLKGRGLVLNEDVKAGDFIIEYTGVAIQKEYLDSMFRRYRMERMLYIMALDNDVYLDARKKGSIARYINHSCEPNCAVHRWKVKGISRAGIFALKDIKAGTELSFDYKWKRKRGRAPTKCHCGAKQCRGTLEEKLDKTEEEEQEEEMLQGHWKKHVKPKGAGVEIMNRTIKVFSPEENEYFLADVCKYESAMNRHCLIYRGEIEETWDNLDEKEWLILDEEMEQFAITRKAKHRQRADNSSLISNDLNMSLVDGNDPIQRSTSPNIKVKNYLILQTTVKDKLEAKHLIDRCQRHHRVQISISPVLSANFPDPEERAEIEKALNESPDGKCWRFSFTGLKPNEAREYLETNIKEINNSDSLNKDDEEVQVQTRHEIVVPRCVAEHVRNRMPLLRNNCKNAEITFTSSKSMSKQFAKLIIESLDPIAASEAQRQLWKEVLTLCNNNDAPRTPKGLFKDLAFYGGELTKEDFDLLCPNLSKVNLSQDCAENLRDYADMSSFEDVYRCTIWVQASEDVGKINTNNQLESKEKNGRRKIFFGTEPKRIPELWQHIKHRIAEIKAGVKFLSLDKEKEFLLFILNAWMGRRDDALAPEENTLPLTFLDYLQKISSAIVEKDTFNQYAIRIDAVNSQMTHNQSPIFLDGTGPDASQQNNAQLVEEVIKLQLQVFRDSCNRRSRWCFGRDWPSLVQEDEKVEVKILQDRERAQPSTPRPQSLSRPSHKRYVANACLEIADITDALGLDGSIAGHATVIMYRYLNQASEELMSTSQANQRDVLLACLFLANKSQKECKWKRLEVLLTNAYKTFYNGARFDPQSEEGSVWEKRILKMEEDIVKTLEYDIFWGGVDWIIPTVCEAGMAEPVAKNLMEVTLSGPILATGPLLWLKLGPAYAFITMAALMQFNISSLFSALSVNPMKVIHCIELVTNSILINKNRRKNSKLTHDIFVGGKETLMEIKNNAIGVCKRKLGTFDSRAHGSDDTVSGMERQYRILSRRNTLRRRIRGINTGMLTTSLLPKFGLIKDQCLCDIFVEEDDKGESVIFEGSWRSLALAEDMMKEFAAKAYIFLSQTFEDDIKNQNETEKKETIRNKPGLLSVAALESVEGWDDVSNSEWKRKIGGKTCLPARIDTKAVTNAGLRWWIRPPYCPSVTASIFMMPELRKSFVDDIQGIHRRELGKLAKVFDDFSNEPQFPLLTSFNLDNTETDVSKFTPVSLQRWPPKKTASKEQERGGMGVGISPAALQEMQILTKLHSIIPGPQGHPNFMLPIAIAVDDTDTEDKNEDKNKVKKIDVLKGSTDDLMDAFFRKQAAEAEEKEKNRKLRGSFLVFQPTPIILQRIVNKNRKKKTDLQDTIVITPTLLTAWFHDLLSALDHCHRNHIILRTIHPDQIFIDNNGVAKLSGLTRSIILHPTDRDRFLDPLSSSKNKKKSGSVTDDDMASNPYMAPELLLGATRYAQESDVWTLASMIAHLMVGKPIFSGKDRKSKTRAIFKIVGTPGTNNYKEATKYPYYDKCAPDKKYKSGVAKALKHMFLESGRDKFKEYADIIELLEKMLTLDPRKRLSCSDALETSTMTGYIEKTREQEFRDKFVEDWKNLKNSLCSEDDRNSLKPKHESGSMSSFGTSSNGNIAGSNLENSSFKRSASYLDKAGGDGDDLYDFGDLGIKRTKYNQF